MPVYLVNSASGISIVRAANGARALQIAGADEADVTALSPDGPEEVIITMSGSDDAEEEQWDDITFLGDTERRFRNRSTGAIRCEPFENSRKGSKS